MNLPQTIKVRMLADGVPTAGLLLGVTLRVSRKNDFSSIWGPSDPEGVITVTRAQLLSKGEADRNMFLMDYGHPEADFIGVINLEPCNRQAVQRAIDAFKEFDGFFDYPAGYEEMLRSSLRTLGATNSRMLSIEILEPLGEVRIEPASVAV